MMKYFILILIVASAHSIHAQAMSGMIPAASAKIVIYKTKADYSKYVPVTLTEDKKLVASYPSKSDIIIDGKYTYPSKLTKGYLLDNRGINKNSVFLDITYEAYSKMENLDPLMLMSHILEKQPFLMMYNCGNRMQHEDLIADMKVEIKKNKLKNCICNFPSQP